MHLRHLLSWNGNSILQKQNNAEESIMSFIGRAFLCIAFAITVSTAQAEVRKPTTEEMSAIESSEIWGRIRELLFDNRQIQKDADDLLALDVPSRAEDAAIVPVAVHTKLLATPERFIRKIYIVIDKNPSPISATFTFTPDSGRADIETRVRVEEYTPVRAIAEMNNGELFMVSRFMKASGGCSAPAGKDAEAAMANAGKMRLRLEREPRFGEPNLAQLMISHPNSSGLAMDQASRLYTPAYFVRRVDVSYAGRPVMSADVDFSISENPNFRFYFTPDKPGELNAVVIDTRDLTFSTRLPVASGS